MPVALFFSLFLLAHAAVGHAELGGLPEQFATDGVTVVSSASSNYIMRDTTLTIGTHVREYVSGKGMVFAVAWDGPFLPELKPLLGKYFEAMDAESTGLSVVGGSQMGMRRPDVVINSSGHMRAFEGSAWLPAHLPAGFSIDNVR